ncbi:MAG: sugar nucleotide-binding protein, partial [Candidatus Omnitrophota bacterium]
GWELDKKFVYKIIRQLKDGKKELMAVSDKFGTPTFTRDFAANLLSVVNSGKYGLYHMVNKGTCSRYDMAAKIVEYMHLAETVKVDPVDSSRFPLPAPRARSEMLENRNLELMGLNNMPHWEESLRIYIEENRNKK